MVDHVFVRPDLHKSPPCFDLGMKIVELNCLSETKDVVRAPDAPIFASSFFGEEPDPYFAVVNNVKGIDQIRPISDREGEKSQSK